MSKGPLHMHRLSLQVKQESILRRPDHMLNMCPLPTFVRFSCCFLYSTGQGDAGGAAVGRRPHRLLRDAGAPTFESGVWSMLLSMLQLMTGMSLHGPQHRHALDGLARVARRGKTCRT